MKVTHKTMVDWPSWKPITQDRKNSQFDSKNIATAAKRVETEVSKFTRNGMSHAWRTKELTIQARQSKTNKDGSFSGGYDNGQASEVVVKFDLDGIDYVIPCDAFNYASENLCAIAKTIEGLRANERYGVMTMKQMMAGVAELPRVSSASRKAWWEVLDVPKEARLMEVNSRYRILAVSRHPNAGGSDQEWLELQEAITTARQVCK